MEATTAAEALLHECLHRSRMELGTSGQVIPSPNHKDQRNMFVGDHYALAARSSDPPKTAIGKKYVTRTTIHNHLHSQSKSGAFARIRSLESWKQITYGI